MAVELGVTKALPRLEAILDDKTATKGEIISAAKEVLNVIPRKDELNLADDPRVKRTIQRVAELVLEVAGPEVHRQVADRLVAEGL
jgi:saccharopine dehydrogenase-like NADP-dependent oxidoreductase